VARFGSDVGGFVAIESGKIAETYVDFDWFVGGAGVQFGMDDGDCAEKEIGNVGEDSGAASGDEVGGEEFVKFGEGVVDSHGGSEFVRLVSKALEEVGGGLRGGLDSGVPGAKAEPKVVSFVTATAASRSTVTAAGFWRGCCECACHGRPQFISLFEPGVYPGCFCEECASH